ncbi:Hypothetical predicted protein [Olea europaea subsp. europaea]|uniref:Uncharacterized protein n=1 Tax=Olea europaea subsp. europaea TaxID=158383 RepID=A0A8S0VFC9_OLEEU|nr:Hypothetical predicted protein [Olea europaea subsp. europaea]
MIRRPPPINHRTITQILRRTTTIFYTHLFTFLLLSLLVFLARRLLEEHYDALITGNDTSVETLLSRFSIHHHRHRNSFTILHNDFYSDIPDFSRTHNLNDPHQSRNSGFSGPQFKFPDGSIFSLENLIKGEDEVIISVERSSGWHDFNMLKAFVHACFVYALAVFTVVVFFSWAHRVVLMQVAYHLLGIHRPWLGILFDAAGHGRTHPHVQFSFMNLRLRTRQALFVTFGLNWYKIQNLYVLLAVFLRAMYVPIVNLVQDPEWDTVAFIMFWFVIDWNMGLIFSVGSRVVFFSNAGNIQEIVNESQELLLMLQKPALAIRILEAIICGPMGRLVLWWILGGNSYYSLGFQCVMEVYFMVAWLVYLFSAMDRIGMTVGRNQLNAILADV